MGSKCNRKTTGGVSVPVGFRFHPTEEELVNHYLRKKKQDKDFKVNHIIPEIAFCKHEPWDLPGLLFTELGSWEEANVGGGGASRDEEAKERGGGGGSDRPPANHTSREDEGLFGHSEISTLGGNVVGGLAMGPGQTEPAPTFEAEVVAAGACVRASRALG